MLLYIISIKCEYDCNYTVIAKHAKQLMHGSVAMTLMLVGATWFRLKGTADQHTQNSCIHTLINPRLYD